VVVTYVGCNVVGLVDGQLRNESEVLAIAVHSLAVLPRDFAIAAVAEPMGWSAAATAVAMVVVAVGFEVFVVAVFAVFVPVVAVEHASVLTLTCRHRSSHPVNSSIDGDQNALPFVVAVILRVGCSYGLSFVVLHIGCSYGRLSFVVLRLGCSYGRLSFVVLRAGCS